MIHELNDIIEKVKSHYEHPIIAPNGKAEGLCLVVIGLEGIKSKVEAYERRIQRLEWMAGSLTDRAIKILNGEFVTVNPYLRTSQEWEKYGRRIERLKARLAKADIRRRG